MGGPLEGVSPEIHVHKITRIQNKEYKVKKLMYKKLPYAFFIWCLDLMILMRANPLLRLLEGRGPENIAFFVPIWHSYFRAQKSFDLQDIHF